MQLLTVCYYHVTYAFQSESPQSIVASVSSNSLPEAGAISEV